MKRWLFAALVFASGCRSCLELGGRAYPCVMDSGLPNECAPNWRCGLEQSGQARCHPVGKPGPFLCTGDDACEGWHCGAEGVCYDRADAGAIACRTDQVDCAPTWRCNGLSETCQDRAVGDAYRCDDDTDCEQRWRCGLDGLCLDVAGEGLRALAGGLGVTRLTPAWTLDGPVTAFHARRSPGAFVLLSAGKLHVFDGTYRTVAAPSGAQSAALVGSRLFVATDGGVLRQTAIGFEPFAPLPNAELRGSADGELLAAWSGSDVFVSGTAADAGVTATAASGVTGANFLGNTVSTTGWLWMATPVGLYVAPPDAGFVPVALPRLRSSCGGAGTDTPLSAQLALRETLLVVEVQPADGGAPAIDLYSNSLGLNAAACNDQGFSPFQGHCAVCGPGSRLHVRRDEDGQSFSVACVGPGPVRSERRVTLAGGTCTSAGAQLAAGVSSADPAAWAWVGTDGTVFHEGMPLTPATAAPAAGTPQDLRLYDKLPGGDRAHFVEAGAAFAAPATHLTQFCAAVPGAPFALGGGADRGVFVFPLARGSAAVDAEAAAAVLDGTTAYGDGGLSCFEDDQPVFHAALAATRDGGQVLVVGGEDRVWAIETTRLASDGGVRGPPVRVLVRTVPAVAGRFQDLAMVNPVLLEGTDHAVGFGLVSSRLFRIRARSSTSWLSEELALPEGEPISLWADGAHARVGYADGRVFSAASRVQLAPTTPARVDAFTSLCGEGFALTGNALYRLTPTPDGGAIGAWLPVDLGPAKLPALGQARLSRTDRAVLVSTVGGVVAQVAVPACP